MSSFQNAVLLCKRSLNYLKASKESFKEGLYDVSSTNCQISAELLIKSTYLLLGYSFPQTHNIRKLLSGLAELTLSEKIKDFVKNKRKDLNMVELNRFEGQYSLIDIDSETASDCLDTVENHLLPLMKSVWGDKWCGD
ncbi:HEPN domain-containing protein [Sulfuracidifex tepidarius]|uniref:HEPN domain-containing protein n=1 Tax=Sulfuracidifex tepidarius TaxID=1294262 RepID=UPI0006D0EE08|nr:HEPN domain-containing protein [Sulfuracidifex tepidarius]